MNSEKYWRYFKYCLLLLSYSVSIISYTSPSLIPPEMFMNMQIKELFNNVIKIIMFSIAIDIVVVLAIDTICQINLIFSKLECRQEMHISINEINKTKMHNLKSNLDVLNPFLYGSKTRCLLE